MDCSPRGSSIHSIFQARILEWVAIFYSRGSSRPRDRTNVSSSTALAGRFFTTRPPGQPLVTMNGEFILFGESWSPLEPFAFRALEIPSRSYRHYIDLQVPLLLPGELRTPLPCKRHPQSEGAGTLSSILFPPSPFCFSMQGAHRPWELLRSRLYRCHYTWHAKVKDSGPVLRPISTSEQGGGECITAMEAGTTWGCQRKKEVRERLAPILLHEISLQKKKKESHGSLNSRSIICHRPCCGPKVQSYPSVQWLGSVSQWQGVTAF